MNHKIFFVFKDKDDDLFHESVWAEKKGDYYQIKNIPCLIPNIAYDDIIRAELDEDEGVLYFDELIEVSGHSVVQLIISDPERINEVGELFETLGCTWEGTFNKVRIGIDIPKDVDYSVIRKVLDEGSSNDTWDFKEACLAEQHRKKLT
jgi:Domain of unknown function (DUF4265)